MDAHTLAKQGVLKQILEMATEEFAKKLKGKKPKSISIQMSAEAPAKGKDLSELRRKLMEE